MKTKFTLTLIALTFVLIPVSSIHGNRAKLNPIEQGNLKAMYSKNGAILTWNNILKKSNVAFVVEKSTDGKSFSYVGKVDGTSSENYQFNDSTKEEGNCYYRLVQIDLNGGYSFSNTVRL